MWSPTVLTDCDLERPSGTPLHRQVRDNLEGKIRRGVLRPYDRLPPVREMAKAFGVGPGTVVQAFAALAQEGLISSRQGSGTFVLPIRPATTALCFPFGSRSTEDPYFQMGQQIIDGLHRGYGPDREIHVFGSTRKQSAEDMWKICRIKNTDGLVFHRTSSEMYEALIELSERMPVVALLQLVGGKGAGQVDSFLCNPKPVFEKLLRERIAEGQRQFAYLALTGDLAGRRQSACDPYVIIYETLCRVLKGARIPLQERTILPDVYDAWHAGHAIPGGCESLPRKTTLIAATPGLARMARQMQPDAELDAISYCSGLYTLRTCGPGMTILYMAMEKAAEKAAQHLQRRNSSNAPAGGQRVFLKPEVIVDYGAEP